MTASLFITGGTGFMGRRLLREAAGTANGVVCLSRTEDPPARAGVQWLRGDLTESGAYASALGPSTVVLHLAAATGKAAAAEHRRVNVEGTRALLRACVERQVSRFVFVSSIAARYPDLRSYPYGASKRDAEALVVQSGLSHVIVRPTIVLGAESPIWQRFSQLAARTVIPLPGTGEVMVQPIHVDDVATALYRLAQGAGGNDAVLELGGPEVVSIAALLARIHRLKHAGDPRFLRIPLAPIRAVLGLLEPWAHRYLPVTAGQLAIFANDSTVEPTQALTAMWPSMMNIDQMLTAMEPVRVAN